MAVSVRPLSVGAGAGPIWAEIPGVPEMGMGQGGSIPAAARPPIQLGTTGDVRRAAKIRMQQQGLPSSGQVFTGPGPTNEPIGKRLIRENQARKQARTMGSVPAAVRNGDPNAVLGGTMTGTGGGASRRAAGGFGRQFYRNATSPLQKGLRSMGLNVGRGTALGIGVGGLAVAGGLIGALRGDMGGGVAGAIGYGALGAGIGVAAGGAYGAYKVLSKRGIGVKEGFSLLGKKTSIPAGTALRARASAVRTAAKFGLIGAASAGLIGAMLNSNRSF